MIRIEGLSKSYGSIEVLKSIDLTIDLGRVHGVVGRNGAGKTTFFKCLASMVSHSGSIAYDGGVLREHCAFLPTRPYIMSHITGQEYLRLMANAKGIQKIDPQIKALFGLPLNRYASSYSTGMQKKLALTGLLLQKREVFLLDEPFNGVDMESNLLIQSLISRLNALGKSVIISSHIFQTLEKSCDVIHHLENGQLAGSHLKDDYSTLEQKLSVGVSDNTIESLDL